MVVGDRLDTVSVALQSSLELAGLIVPDLDGCVFGCARQLQTASERACLRERPSYLRVMGVELNGSDVVTMSREGKLLGKPRQPVSVLLLVLAVLHLANLALELGNLAA